MKRMLIAAAVLALVTAACGGGDDNPAMEMESPGAKTVEIKMVDIAFEPKSIEVKAGERIEFVFENRGAIAHDAFIGDSAAQAEHEREMRAAEGGSASDTTAGHGMGGGDGDKLTVEPGKTGRLTYTFNRPGTLEIGCHQPDHYAAGMKIAVTVA